VSHVRALVSWVLLFVAALVVRSLRFGLVFVDGEVRFPHGADELYHLRRIWFSVVNFPAALLFDTYMNHPEGAAPHWPPFFDWGIAAFARVFAGPGDQHGVERVAAWAPPVLGAFTVVAAAGLARRTFSPAAGWATGGLLAMLPAHVLHSSLGVVDHHVAVGLFATLLLAAAMRLAAPLGPVGRPHGVVATGGMIAASLLLWPGSLLFVLVVQLFLVAQVLVSAERAVALARARALATAHALAAALLVPFCAGREWEDFGSVSPWVLSNFQPLWFGAGAVTLALAAALWSRSPVGAARPGRIASALGLGAAGLAAAWLGVPGLAAALDDAAGWFEADAFLGVILELRPLLAPDRRLEVGYGSAKFSHLFWVFPLVAAGLVGQALVRRRGDVGLLVTVSTAFLGLTLYQQRFSDVSAGFFALVVGPALVEAFRAARRRIPAPRLVWAGLGAALAAAALLPQAAGYRVEALASLTSLRGDRIGFLPHVRRRIVLERAAHWLERATPPTRGYLDPEVRPEYGVLGAWGQGHVLRYYGERPMVQDNFGPWGGRSGFEAARRYFASRDEGEAVELAGRLRARYVVATDRGSGQIPPRPGTLALRLVPVPVAGGGLALRGRADEALAQHRLVFVADDADLAHGPGERPWRVAVYEIVRGAQVVGRAAASDERVRFELAVPLPGRPSARYRAEAPVDAAGRYQIRLPYPAPSGYTVRAGSRRESLALSEADVREGRTVAGPSFAR